VRANKRGHLPEDPLENDDEDDKKCVRYHISV
jgi:hypothetical protein